MKINTFTTAAVAATVFGEASASGPACTSSISSVSPFDPLGTLISQCTAAPATDFASSAEYTAFINACVSVLATNAGSAFPASTGSTATCFNCYTNFAKALVDAAVGSYVISFTGPTSNTLGATCSEIATSAVKREACFKDPKVIAAMDVFQTCSGYGPVFPAPSSLAELRKFWREGLFSKMVQSAFNPTTRAAQIADPDAIYTDLINGSGVAATAATGADLLGQLCFDEFDYHLKTYATTGSPAPSIVNDCGSTMPTNVGCFNSTILTVAKARFANCSGQQIDQFYPACTADGLSTLHQNYDALGELVSDVIGTWNLTNFTTSVEAIVADISAQAGDDCGVCYLELAQDIQANIESNIYRPSGPSDNNAVFSQFLNSCMVPTSDECLMVLGSLSLTNYQQCAGAALDRSVFMPATTTVAPVTTTAAPETTTAAPVETTTAAPVETTVAPDTTTAAPVTTKSAMSTIAPFASVAMMAIASVMML